jgi:hypothetical protein
MNGKFASGFGNGPNRVFEEVAPTVFGISGHSMNCYSGQMVKPPMQQGRSARKAEAYSSLYVGPLSDARTKLIGSFTILPLHHAVRSEFIHFDAAVAGSKFDVPARMIFADEIQDIRLDLIGHILHPGIGGKPAERARKARHEHDFVGCVWNFATLDIDSPVHYTQRIRGHFDQL